MEPMQAQSVTTPSVSGVLTHPGTLPLCQTCANWLNRHWAAGHPTPCARVRWLGTAHHKPAMMETAGTVVCGEYEPLVVEVVVPVVPQTVEVV